jgi:hypothetical protein
MLRCFRATAFTFVEHVGKQETTDMCIAISQRHCLPWRPGDDKGMGAVVRQLELPRINFSDVDSSLPALLVVMADSKLSVRAYHTMSDESITNLHQFCYLCVHEASRLTDEFLAVSRL